MKDIKFSNISNVSVLINFTGTNSPVIINNVTFENMNVTGVPVTLKGVKLDFQNVSYSNVTFFTCWGISLYKAFGIIN